MNLHFSGQTIRPTRQVGLVLAWFKSYILARTWCLVH